jgi:hypothetical protein
MASYTYTINGKKYRASRQLTDQELEELATPVQEVTPASVYEAVGSQGQAIPGISTAVPEVTPSNVQPESLPLVATSGFARGLKDPINAGAQMLPRALSTATSLGGIVPNMFSDWFQSEAQRVDAMVKAEEQQYQQQRKVEGDTGIDWSRMAGNIINPATLTVASSVSRVLPAAAGVLGSGAATGVATGALQPVTEGGFAEEKLKQSAVGAVGGALGSAAVAGAGRVMNPLVSKAEQTMRELGVKLTPGQMMGGQAKTFEEFAQNLPLIGGSIVKAKERALYSFNKGVINKALAKVGEKLPEDVVGRDAVQYVDDIISQKYDDVLSKINFQMNPAAFQNISTALKTKALPSTQQNEVVDSLLNSIVYSRIPANTPITGQAFKAVESDLNKAVSNYANSSLASERQIGEALSAASKALKKTLAVQNPTQSSILRRIDNAYGDVTVMRAAAANSGAVNGVFTPNQYKTAVRQRDVTRNKTAFAAGRARGQDIADDAVKILGRDPSSTLEGRLATQVGGGLAALAAPQIAVPVAVAAPAMYSETGIKVITALMRTRPELAKQIGEVLTARAGKEGSITGTQIIKEYNRLTKTEE